MKSERRHELETNQLADSLAKFWLYLRDHGSRILLGVLLVALVILFFYNRSHSKKADLRLAMDQLAAAREGIARLRNFEPLAPNAKDEERANHFRDLVKLTRENLTGALKTLHEPEHMAEALVAHGDLNWTIASYPQVPGAGEIPPAPSDEERSTAIKQAQEAYQRVLANYPKATMAVLSAHLGLAAIAEDLSNWDEARKHYEAVAGDERFPQSFRDQAQERLASLDDIRRPVLLVQPRQPLILAPSTQPATQSSAAPATQPAQAPSTTAPAAP